MTAKLLFFKTPNNTVSVKVNLGKDKQNGFSYRQGTRRGIRFNNGEDKQEYPYIVTYTVLDTFLEANGIKDEDVVIDENSIDYFYGYDSQFFVSITPSKIERWWNYDCPNLYRYAVNKDGHTNWFGLKLVCFCNLLVESSWNYTHIGEDITEEEVEKIAGNYKHTAIYKEMEKVLESRKLTESDIEECENFVKNYEEKIQEVIDDHKLEILEYTIKSFADMFKNPDRLKRLNNYLSEVEGPHITSLSNVEDFKTSLFEAINTDKEKFYPQVVMALDGSFGLDIGWVNIYTRNEEYNHNKKLLKNLPNKRAADWMDIRIPIMCQSTTIQKKQFEKAKEIIKEKLGEELYSITQLD